MLMDPRWNTDYAYEYKGPLFQDGKSTFLLPQTINEKWCRPGYQPKRPDKGIDLLITNYYFHQNRYGDSWKNVTYTSKY